MGGFVRTAAGLVLAFVLLFSEARALGASGPVPVDRLEIRYAGPADGLPALRDVLYDEVELVESGGVLDAPGMGSIVRRYRIFELVSGGRTRLTSSAVDAVLEAVSGSLADRGAPGLVVRPAADQLERVDGVWEDRRRFGARLTIEVSRTGGLGTAPGSGEGLPNAAVSGGPAVGPALPALTPLASDGAPFELTAVDVSYVRDHPGHPPIAGLLATPVALTPTPDGFVAPRAYGPVVVQPIGAIGREAPAVLYGSALAAVSESIVQRLREAGLVGMYVVPAPDDVPSTSSGLVDRREGQTGPFPFVVYTAIVTRVGSSATGDRIGLEERIDHPHHRRIRENSPVLPWSGRTEEIEPGTEDGAGLMTVEPETGGPGDSGDDSGGAGEGDDPGPRRDLLREDLLNAYAFRLNRHPGRRVDVAIAPGQEDFEAELQYLVREDKPWTAFVQLSNTGTESTSEFRQRFGFVHTQLTNADDILNLDYTTAEFDSANAYNVAYQRPLLGSDRHRWRVSGGFNEFTASDVGANGEAFEGESYFFSGELESTVFQVDELFVDAYVGARYQDIEVNDLSLGATGAAREAIFLPRVGVRVERLGGWSSLSASSQIEWSINELTGAEEEGLEELGRIGPVENWVTYSGSLNASVFLEPLLNYRGWTDPSTPASSTLAHELSFRVFGQYAFNERLIPNAEGVIGGLFTVRGYPESAVAGDSTIFGSLEYRFHVPRVFGVDPTPASLFGRPFRVAPQQVYGAPDWDLVLKGFLDFGRSYISQPLGFEQGEELASAGVGLELQVYRNLSFRTDWAFVLSAIGSPGGTEVDRGDSRVHLLFTLAF